MRQALRLAAKGRGLTSPNPLVGALVVQRGRLVGSGAHLWAGGPHAEIIALEKAGPRSRGATLFVTLEPCCHKDKRTPPCLPAIIRAGIRRVVVGIPDPNPRVDGQGIEQLRQNGLDVQVGCLRDAAQRQNEIYCHWIRTGYPFVILKAAMTLDGKIATVTGESQWITGPRAREDGHRLRSQVDAVLVGIETVVKDDPLLTARLPHGRGGAKGRQPLRVILDSRLRLPLAARLLSFDEGGPVLVATTTRAPKERVTRLKKRGVRVWTLPAHDGRVSLHACFKRLGQANITSVLVEGGSEVHASVLRAGFANRVIFYCAPRLLGGASTPSVIGGPPPRHLEEGIAMDDVEIRRIDGDWRIQGTVRTTTPE